MKKLALLVSALALAGLFVSCNEKKTVADEGSVIHVQVGPSPETIDPALNSTVDGANMIIHAFEGLLKFDRDNNIVAACADKWEASSDGLTWTFHLRDGLKWSDGSDLTAADFVYAWQRVADPATAAPYGYDLLNVVEGFDVASTPAENGGDVTKLGVSAPDAKTFVVKLTTPCIYFDKIAAFAVLVPVQAAAIAKAGDAWSTSPASYVCNGPYYMSEFTDGAQIVFKKNPYYWDAANITFDTIVWHLIEDPNTSYTAYNQNEVQLIKDVPTEEIPALTGNSEFYVEPLMGTYYVTFNTQKEPFNDPRVREALSLAIDRKHVATTIMQGTYSPATNFVGLGVSDAEPGSSYAEVTTKTYGDHFSTENYDKDLARAKELLAEAGYPNGTGFPTFEYLTNDASYHKAVAEYLQAAWAELGLTMNVNIQEWKTVSADRRAGNFDVARNGWVYDWDDPSNMINLLETGNGNNDGKYSSEEFDNLVRLARTTTDVKEHYNYLHQAEQVLLKDAAMAPVAYYNEFWLQKSNLKGTWHSPYGYWYLMYGKLE
ncbi:MAG: peptide ABC transporter substrate-binding protein [Treponema sp.]|nr:peptide ABC transporter substrate-binding protein [Treponema sp.]MBR6914235.1 peptide ABC transporter substrate-binding protein [Treponema sp.]